MAQTLNPNRDSNRVIFSAIDTVHWSKAPSSISEHHAMAGSGRNIRLTKSTGASGGASVSGASASASSPIASKVGSTLNIKGKISVF